MSKLSVIVLFLFFTLSLARTPLTQPENDVTHLKLPSEHDVVLPEHPNILPESNEETRSVQHVPLTLVRFRPINRRFRLRSNLPFRLCRHHRNPVYKHQIPYGNNDMILSSKNNNIDFDKLVYRIGVSRFPADRFNFHRHDNYHREKDVTSNKKMWKFLDDHEKFGKMKLKDQLPHHHHHHDDNEEDDHEQRKISKFLDRGSFGEINSANGNQIHAHHVDDDEADKRAKLYTKHHEMKLRKHFRYNDGEEEDKAKEEKKWHKREMKKGGIMRSVRKFLHHYFD